MILRAWRVKSILLGVCLLAGAHAFAASPEDPQSESASPSALPLDDPLGSARTVNWKSLAPNILHDQKSIWTFPSQLAHGEHWKPALGVTAAVGALVALDAYDTPYFGRTSAFSGFNRSFSGRNTALAFSLVPVTFYALGQARKDSYATQTSLLSAEALVDAEILAWVFKTADGRLRPAAIPVGGNYSDTWFESYHSPLAGHGSFPSGHTIAAFSIATVFARRYGSHRWVPWVAYGSAGLIGFSRITLQAHFPSDVFAGAAFGYVISRYVVLRGRGR
ncbi:MAG: phosphatase PAP2 family protein [Acidobacteriota bacterium]|nr:phosphatase PAP2 family protein [Acidobacteriota bacterium]